jgi:hypothetical protein
MSTEYYYKHKDKMRESHKKWYAKNKEKCAKYYQERRKNPEFLQRTSEKNKIWRQTHKEQMKESQKKYYMEHKIQLKEKRKKYYWENKEEQNKYCREYHKKVYPYKKEQLIQYQKEYRKTEAGKEMERRKKAKRRKMSYIPLLNNFYPDDIPIEWHHINNYFVIPIPKYIHQGYLGLDHKKKCNEWIEKYYNINLKRLVYDY